MKFIISRYSPKMIQAMQFDLAWSRLSEEEFRLASYDAYSCIGAKDVADLLGFAYNVEPVKARIGDTLLLADWNNGVLDFYCIRIYEPQTPLVREEEIEYEEMI